MIGARVADMTKYAGIGSRKTPPEALRLMEDFAHAMASHSILRSGGADGADTAFEFGATLGGGQREIFLPWKGFNGRTDALLDEPSETAMEIAAYYHPAWGQLSQGGRKLHGRNTHQVLGANCDDPVAMIICWTPGGKGGGGTGQALRMAKDREIDIWDLALPEHEEAIVEVIAQDGIPLK